MGVTNNNWRMAGRAGLREGRRDGDCALRLKMCLDHNITTRMSHPVSVRTRRFRLDSIQARDNPPQHSQPQQKTAGRSCEKCAGTEHHPDIPRSICAVGQELAPPPPRVEICI